ncbi:hypothetical protein LBMAG42_51340 [Deltaproteobacteria bacterium]|nr:hypothetical protein LBMAG42_51340 [Deltaproteobacteria bacterium]
MRSILIFSLLGAMACEQDTTLSHVADIYGQGEGAISGRVCDPDAYVWLEGASIYTHIIDSSGELRDVRETLSDADGNWKLENMADGVYTVYIQYGSTTLDMFDAKVENGRETEVENGSCESSADVEVAVVTGDFDDFDEVLKEAGIGGAHEVDGQTGAELLQFLLNPDEMSGYDAIFFAGGHLEDGIFYSIDGSDAADVELVIANLKEYVTKGGVLFASDWSYDVIEETWPSQIDFLGDGSPDSAQVGEPGLYECDIKNNGLADELGNEQVKMDLDLDAWPVVDSVADEVKVILASDVTWRQGMDTDVEKSSPILVEFESGKGKVVFTPFRMSANLDGQRLKVVKWILDRELAE